MFLGSNLILPDPREGIAEGGTKKSDKKPTNELLADFPSTVQKAPVSEEVPSVGCIGPWAPLWPVRRPTAARPAPLSPPRCA